MAGLNIQYVVNICKGSTGTCLWSKTEYMGSENSSKSLRKRFQTTLNRLKSLDPGLRHRDTGSIFNMCQHLQVIGLGQHSILLTTFARERRQYPTPTFAPESSINCQRVTPSASHFPHMSMHMFSHSIHSSPREFYETFVCSHPQQNISPRKMST